MTFMNILTLYHLEIIRLFQDEASFGELYPREIKIKIEDVNLRQCQIKINDGKGHKDRVVPFPKGFREVLVAYIKSCKEKQAIYLFESIRKGSYTDRGIRKILLHYSKLAKMKYTMTPHKLRHFLLTWMKKQGVDDALIQPYSGHDSRKSLEIYSKLSITDAQKKYDEVINNFPIQPKSSKNEKRSYSLSSSRYGIQNEQKSL